MIRARRLISVCTLWGMWGLLGGVLPAPCVPDPCGIPSAGAQTDAARASSPPPAKFLAGFDTRIREVTLHNLVDFDDAAGPASPALGKVSDAHFFRVRHRLWGQLRFRGGTNFYTRITTEWRKYLDPYESPAKTEIIVDNLYLDLPRVPHLPISLRIGRQDLMRGEGFILLEGGPNDGSRSIYQNAVLIGFDGKRLGWGATRIELLAIRNPAWDEFILTNGPDEKAKTAGQRRIVENDETAFGLYLTRKSIGEQTLESYYIYKEEEAPAAKEPHLKLSTVGARWSGRLPWETQFALEGAYQFGAHEPAALAPGGAAEGYDHRSYGGYAWVSRDLPALFLPTLHAGVIYLSGDRPGRTGDEDPEDQGWYPVFSRWPKWSEMYIYTQIGESGRVAQWTNLLAPHVGLRLRLHPRATLAYTYYRLQAPEARNPDGAGNPFLAAGKLRGDHHQWKFSAEISKRVSAHFLVERLAPGDYYAQPQDDAFFLRWELMFNR